MKLSHFTADILTKDKLISRRQFPITHKNNGRTYLSGKPRGFWVSDETRGAYGWRNWCQGERFRLYSLKYEYRIELVPNAKILYLNTVEDIDAFTAEYGYSLLKTLDPGYDTKIIDGIDWQRVAKKWHGIIITPYQYQRRLELHTSWYYTWDCASGCIWNMKAIDSVTLIRERKTPRKPSTWEEKRKRKRMMVRMAKASKEMVKSMQEMRGPSPMDTELVKNADALIDKYGGKK